MKYFYTFLLLNYMISSYSIEHSTKTTEVDYDYIVQGDQKIITFGTIISGINYSFALSRYTAAGSLDTTFGTNGTTTITSDTLEFVNTCTLQVDNTLWIDGFVAHGINQDYIILHYTNLGVLDTTFGIQGKVTVAHTTLDSVIGYKRLSDGTFFISGYKISGTNVYFALLKYTAQGVLNRSFGNNGLLITPIRTFLLETHESEIEELTTVTS